MKTYVITLERSVERSRYIKHHVEKRNLNYQIISAVDGSLLTKNDIEQKCNVEAVERHRGWLTNGAIGCALSHLKAYEEFIKTSDNAACIIEDDVILPQNINTILEECKTEIRPSEIILLYYVSFNPAKLSTLGKVKLSHGGLYYPMDIKQTITTAAYVIGRKAAENLSKMIIPVEVAADTWHHYYSKEAFRSFRVHYPSHISTKNFKSSIDYLKKGSLKQKASTFIYDYKVPVAYQILQFLRKRNRNKMVNLYSLTDEISPVYEKLLSSNKSDQQD